ncbi:ATP-binding cassette domain-containing protein [Polycladidibacter stylochi]|uniref:ATP-binding cassette domain-containing protein n=1 Tax=Polycladidibacter stylochi TaxID=1807766 RepID=UPI000837153E|nr:ATP-binding cassette domain-containing protein [Pseudovibrio stylochi]
MGVSTSLTKDVRDEHKQQADHQDHSQLPQAGTPQTIDDYGFEDPYAGVLQILAQQLDHPVNISRLQERYLRTGERFSIQQFQRAANECGFILKRTNAPISSLSDLLLPALINLKGVGPVVAIATHGENKITVALPQAAGGTINMQHSEIALKSSTPIYLVKTKPSKRLKQQEKIKATTLKSPQLTLGLLSLSFVFFSLALLLGATVLQMPQSTDGQTTAGFNWPNMNTQSYIWLCLIGLLPVSYYLIERIKLSIARAYENKLRFTCELNKLEALLSPKTMGKSWKSATSPHTSPAYTPTHHRPHTLSICDRANAIFLCLVAIAASTTQPHFLAIALLQFILLCAHLLLNRPAADTQQSADKPTQNLLLSKSLVETIVTSALYHKVRGYLARSFQAVEAREFQENWQTAFIKAVLLTSLGLGLAFELSMQGTLHLSALATLSIITLSTAAQWNLLGTRSPARTYSQNGDQPAHIGRNTAKPHVARKIEHGEIEIKKLTLKQTGYNNKNTNENILSNINLQIKAGEKTAILGATGSGKTSLLKTIGGIYLPQKGQVIIDGLELSSYFPAERAASITAIFQGIRLWPYDLFTNFQRSYYKPSLEDIICAAQKAGATNVFNRLLNCEQTQLSAELQQLSAGELQALQMIKAFINHPPIVLLDDPTGTMDTKTEEHIIKELQQHIQPHQTLLMTTHRSTPLDLVDRVIIIDRGQIIADEQK